MEEKKFNWQIYANQQAFEIARQDKKFKFIVCLGRAANALNSVNSLMLIGGPATTVRANRDRINSFFMASALFYEIMKLIKRMNAAFVDDEMFQTRLRLILKDPVAQRIESTHLNPIRHRAAFHFDPDGFDETIQKSSVKECLFVRGEGDKKVDVDYSFSDVIAAEILVGFAEDSEEFYAALGQAMEDISGLVTRFMSCAEDVIGHNMKGWGFQKRTW